MAGNGTVIETLKGESHRLDRLIGLIDNGRWWTREEPSRIEITALVEQAALIGAAIDVIESKVGHLGRAQQADLARLS